MKKNRILFFVPGMDVINNGVYFSQVLGLARYLVTIGAECLVVYSTMKEREYRIFERYGVGLIHCPDELEYVPLPFIARKYRRIVEPIMKEIEQFSPTHIYVRDPFSGVAGLSLVKKFGAKLVFSRRGAGMSTGKKSIKDYIKEGISRFFVGLIFRKANHLNTVSEYLKKKEQRWFKKEISVLPCCIMEEKLVQISNKEREACRKELGIPLKAKVVIYSGGMSHYQCIEDILKVMKQMHDLDRNLFFMILTQEQEVLKSKISSAGLPTECYRTRSCSPTEVSTYLQSADVAIILRHNDMENRVASPVKIGEYLSSGLGVIVSPWIGDMGEKLKDKTFAFLFKDLFSVKDAVAFVNRMDEIKSCAARTFASEYYTYDGNKEVIMNMFK